MVKQVTLVKARVRHVLLMTLKTAIAGSGLWYVISQLQWTGFSHLLDTANPWLLIAALLLVGMPAFITTWRWRRLLAIPKLDLSYRQCLSLTFVGQFYSAFLPGLTADVVKIVYSGRATGEPTKCGVAVFLDRALGLAGLMMLAMATMTTVVLFSFLRPGGIPADRLLTHILWLTTAGLLVLVGGAILYFSDGVRRWLRIDAWLERLPLPRFVKHAHSTLQTYGRHPGLLAGLLLLSLASWAISPLATFLVGQALGMHASVWAYAAYIPVMALAISVPIVPPQGLGVLDALMLYFFVSRGVDSADQAFALVQTLRIASGMWAMIGAYWVVRGRYPRPNAATLNELARTENV